VCVCGGAYSCVGVLTVVGHTVRVCVCVGALFHICEFVIYMSISAQDPSIPRCVYEHMCVCVFLRIRVFANVHICDVCVYQLKI